MSNINVTPGTGKTVSTDTVGGVEYQYIKIIDGTAGNNSNTAAVSANGLEVDITASVLPTGAATSAKQDTGNTSLASIDSKITAVNTGAVTISAALPAGTNAIGKLAANSGVDIGDVDVTTVGTITPGTAASSLGKAEDAAHASGDVGVFSLGVANEAQTSLAADGDYIAQATDVKGNTLNVGNVAHDGVDAGNPVKIGGKAVSAEPAAVAAADRVNAIFDLVGKLIVLPYSNPENLLTGTITTAMTGTTDTAVSGMGAQGGSLRNYVTSVIISNAHATVGTDVVLKDGSGGTVLGTFPAAAVYGGVAITLPSPLKTTANTALYAANITTGASTKVTCYGYKGI